MDEMTFRDFFRALHGYDPFPWQSRLASQVCEGAWPHVIDLPTASGKTACIDIALYAMAVTGKGPRRVFFVVDRRVVVDAAYDRMRDIANKINEAKSGVLGTVAGRLREMAGCKPDQDAVAAYEMRGGIYRDDSWVRSPLQPTLIASTVDQIGSRLLFRGYGVWDNVLPMHAALVANDSLILLDEAHCSRPFAETVAAVQKYRSKDWAPGMPESPFLFVEMTATPRDPSGLRFILEKEDYEHEHLRQRLYASKPTALIESKARANEADKLAADLVSEAHRLAKQPGLRRVAIVVNRVLTARAVFARLKKEGACVHLLIGRMRPIDREQLPSEVAAMFAGKKRNEQVPVFVVATQCLEVGADLDFDALVTECASLDALLQRFGRLDRIGALTVSGVKPQGVVVMPTPAKEDDPIYGKALVNTWQWLRGAKAPVDFGICSADGTPTVRERAADQATGHLRREMPRPPTLLPVHLDTFVQTSPRPALEPDVSLFLHGPDSAPPDVQVVWRADLDTERPDEWAEVVALCPPVSAETMAVPITVFKRWLMKTDPETASNSDIQGIGDRDEEDTAREPRTPVLRWCGDQSEVVKTNSEARRIRPGDTLVLPVVAGGWDDLGHIPENADKDVAEHARHALRRNLVLRLHPKVIEQWPESESRNALLATSKDPAVERDTLLNLLDAYTGGPEWLTGLAKELSRMRRRVMQDAYPAGEGWVLTGPLPEADSGGDESSSAAKVELHQHIEDVQRQVVLFSDRLVNENSARAALTAAANAHDAGKADIRFQALLHGGDQIAAQLSPVLLAKGNQAKRSRAVRTAQWRESGLPDGFRHELLSLLLLPESTDDLVLHLVASHHGRCRPFAPVVQDLGGDLQYNGWAIRAKDRRDRAPHLVGSGVPDRFWRLTRQYGWWGLAWLETILRLADWEASKDEQCDSQQ